MANFKITLTETVEQCRKQQCQEALKLSESFMGNWRDTFYKKASEGETQAMYSLREYLKYPPGDIRYGVVDLCRKIAALPDRCVRLTDDIAGPVKFSWQQDKLALVVSWGW
jgi:hypothetical protein